MIEQNKICSKCKIEKNLSEFNKDKYKPNGFTSQCKECRYINTKKWYLQNKEKCSLGNKLYHQIHRERILSRKKELSHLSSNREKRREYERKRRKIPNVRIARNLRIRLANILKGREKVGSFVHDLGCSIEELKIYLEKQFYPNPETDEMMTWENYGFYGWHIDHIKPLANFNLEDRKQFLQACHYTNLQPMWMKQNMAKHNF